jgi:hypothetical protein
MTQTADKTSNSTQHLKDDPDQYTKNYCEENIYWLTRSFLDKEEINRKFVVFISNQSQQVTAFAFSINSANKTKKSPPPPRRSLLSPCSLLITQIPIWSQRSSSRPDQLSIWDYHVILLALSEISTATDNPTTLIYDLDTSLPSPTPLSNYIQHALVIKSSELPETHRRLFRVIPAMSYLENFASDRSHMLKSKINNENTSGGGGGEEGGGGDGAINGTCIEYMSPRPSYPCIVSSRGDTNTLLKYLEMPSYTQAVSNWRETPLEKIINKTTKDGGDSDDLKKLCVDTLPYGVVLTEDAFLEFATNVTKAL